MYTRLVTQYREMDCGKYVGNWDQTKDVESPSSSTVAPRPFFNEVAGLETGSRPYLLKHGAPCHPDVVIRLFFAQKKVF